jgi:UDP-N-acetylmuramoylalanine--D-glutamate ligase
VNSKPSLVEGQQQVLRSPGPDARASRAVEQAARERGIPVAWRAEPVRRCAASLREAVEQGYAPAVLAVTGTNGKTTVTSLTGQLVERSRQDRGRGRQHRPDLLDTLAERIASRALPQVWVLELSSFQLEGVEGFEPTAATVLNVTQDHLDWHGGMDAYAAAKARVFGGKALMVLNRDDPA